MDSDKLPRRERDKLRQRQEILAAALELFSQKGYHNVSVNEIAEKAEFAIGTLYKFFPNKEDLYKALVLEKCEICHDKLGQVLDKPIDEVEKLRNYVRAKGELFYKNLPFVRLYVTESRGVGFTLKAGLDGEARKGYYCLLDKLASVFESGMMNKRLREVADPFKLAVALDSAINSFLLLWLESPDRHPFPEDPDGILNIFFKGLLDSNT